MFIYKSICDKLEIEGFSCVHQCHPIWLNVVEGAETWVGQQKSIQEQLGQTSYEAHSKRIEEITLKGQ